VSRAAQRGSGGKSGQASADDDDLSHRNARFGKGKLRCDGNRLPTAAAAAAG
jgi:hypothetical protein